MMPWRAPATSPPRIMPSMSRCGAGFPTGMKWELVRNQPGPEKYIVCNADETAEPARLQRGDEPRPVLRLRERSQHAVLRRRVGIGIARDRRAHPAHAPVACDPHP